MYLYILTNQFYHNFDTFSHKILKIDRKYLLVEAMSLI